MRQMQKATKTYNSGNFHRCTAAVWTPVRCPRRKPDYISDSGSRYWYTADGKAVIRSSNHWGEGVGNCVWFLAGHKRFTQPSDGYGCEESLSGRRFAGYCEFKDFEPAFPRRWQRWFSMKKIGKFFEVPSEFIGWSPLPPTPGRNCNG